MFKLNNEEESLAAKHIRKPQKKITPQRLKNIGLYYLERFESSRANLRQVLMRRVMAYAHENPQYHSDEAKAWIEDILDEFERLHYLDDERFARLKAQSYVASGKPSRYIRGKLKEKGIADQLIDKVLALQECDETAMAMQLAKRKKIGPFRKDEDRAAMRQKDMGVLLRAGFDYDVVQDVLNCNLADAE